MPTNDIVTRLKGEPPSTTEHWAPLEPRRIQTTNGGSYWESSISFVFSNGVVITRLLPGRLTKDSALMQAVRECSSDNPSGPAKPEFEATMTEFYRQNP